MGADAGGGEPFGVLDRITAIFEAFDEDDFGLGISDLAVRANLPKSTVSRLVADLVRQRYLERDGKMIHLGVRLFELGQLAERPQELRYAALPAMADLRGVTGETVHLAIRDGREMVYIAIVRSRTSAAVTSRIGGRVPVHATALGKAVLAHASASEIDDLLAADLERRTPHTIVDPISLRGQLAEIRRTGTATEVRESAPDIACVASPVLDAGGRVLAAVSVSGSADSFDAGRIAPAVRTTALTLRRRIAAGGHVPA